MLMMCWVLWLLLYYKFTAEFFQRIKKIGQHLAYFYAQKVDCVLRHCPAER